MENLPLLNATLNFLAAVCLMAGFIAIKKGKREEHKRWMICAFSLSCLFLVSYLTYHFTTEGITRYTRGGLLRIVYFSILISHILLAVTVAPGSIRLLWLAYKGEFDKHKKTAVYMWPVWMYVSVTGVVIYIMLYIL